MHDVQTLMRCLLPPGRVATRTLWMLGSHRRLVRRWECDTDLPKPGPFPQISQTAAIRETPQISGANDLQRPDGWPDDLARIAAAGQNRQNDQHAPGAMRPVLSASMDRWGA